MQNKKIVLIGGGGHCKSVLDAVIRSCGFTEVVITDPGILSGTMILGCNVIGNDDLLSELFSRGFQCAFVTIGSITSTVKRREMFLKAKEIGFYLPAIINTGAIIEHGRCAQKRCCRKRD